VRAVESRADLAAQLKTLDALEKDYAAARAERIPSLAGFADYGTLGSGPDHAIPTWMVGVQLSLPVFDGGGMEARRAESRARLEQERLKTEDLRREIKLEVELALAAIQIAEGEISVVESGLAEANLELEQARRRYQAGVTTSLEITEAQANLKAAEEARIGALYRFNIARIQLADATGVLRNDGRP
jgi:outer membrane protein TolC